ncbi:MAG: hypothetical protein MPJ78_01625 [Hyphomicrobiaceae bacterium]|nr:hypothetical protein [Hyphomicrobiaceae bacterium]
MIEWLAEINWIMVVSVAVGVMAGVELGRRRSEAKGAIYSFLPRPMYRLLNLGTALSGALFFEAARVAVDMPTAFHVWMLLFFTAAGFILFGISTGLELKSAKALLNPSEEGQNGTAEMG